LGGSGAEAAITIIKSIIPRIKNIQTFKKQLKNIIGKMYAMIPELLITSVWINIEIARNQ